MALYDEHDVARTREQERTRIDAGRGTGGILGAILIAVGVLLAWAVYATSEAPPSSVQQSEPPAPRAPATTEPLQKPAPNQ